MADIQYLRGTECGMDALFAAFQTGFSDYTIQFHLTKEQFADHFFGEEGNALEYSFVALREDEPIGLVLGGIKEYEGIRTMRCGALAVRPGERRAGVAVRMMELHRDEAVRQGCRQLYLEVISGNDRAVAFYDKQGYAKGYDLSYFSLRDGSYLGSRVDEENVAISVSPIDVETFETWVQSRRYFHLNWQNDLDYLRLSGGYVYYGAFLDGELIGVLGMVRSGRISVLLVDLRFRDRGAAKLLISTAVRDLGLTKLSVSLANNALMEGFLQHLGFSRDSLSQYELYAPLGK